MKNIFVLFVILISFCFASLNKSIEFTSNKVSISNSFKANDGNLYQTVSYGTEIKIHEEGKPELPVLYKQYIISADEDPDDIIYHVVGKSIEYVLSDPLFPSQKDIFDPLYDKEVFILPDENIYSSDEIYPENAVEVIKDGWLDGNHIVQLAFYPIQYSPVDNKLIFHENIYFQLNTRSGSRRPDPVRKRSKYSQNVYDSALKMAVDNDEDISLYQVKPNQYLSKTLADSADLKYYDYIIITKDSLISAFDDLVEWKKRKGIDIGIIDVDSIISAYPNGDEISGLNDDAGSVRQYLINAYQNGTTYVLIGGDDEIVPIRYCDREYTPPSDLYYSDLSNDWYDNVNDEVAANISYYDAYPEVFVGRITANTINEVKNWINKQITYEQDPGRGDPSYLINSLFTHVDETQQGDYFGFIDYWVDDLGFNFNVMEEEPTYYDLWPTAPSPVDVINEMNNGYGLISYFTHGSRYSMLVRSGSYAENATWRERITTFETELEGSVGGGFNNLTNFGYPGIIFANACNTCGFDENNPYYGNSYYDEDFSEMYLCYNKEAGGVAYFGNTRASTAMQGTNLLQCMFSYLCDGIVTLGKTYGISKANRGASICFTMNLFGCPETMMWTEVPTEFSNVMITDYSNYITVNTGESDCFVCVSADDTDDYWKADSVQTDTFQTSIRPLHVVITKKNKLPYINLYGLQNITGTITLNNKYAYTITNDITVTSTGVLNIEPGTTLRFAEDKELKVYGELNVNGTEESPVVFTSDDVDAGSSYWTGLRAYSGSEINADNLKIYNATCGVRSDYAKVTLDSCLIKDTHYGIMIYNCIGSNSCTVNRSSLENNYSYGIYYYNSDGNITRNTISNTLRGIYARGNVNIRYNDLTDFTYDAIRCENYDGDIQFNDMSDCRYGVYFMSSASGDMLNIWYPDQPMSNAENNIFHTPMTSCIWISSTSTPDIGTLGEDPEAICMGWNVFCDPSSYDIYSAYTGTIKAQGNWWGTKVTYGTIDYVPIATDVPYYFGKSVASSTSSELKFHASDELFEEAIQCEIDTLLENAIDIYKTIIENYAYSFDMYIQQKALNRMRGCYRKLGQYDELNKVLTTISQKYSDSYIGYYAQYLNSPQYCLKEDFAEALLLLDDSFEGFNNLKKSETAAFVLLDKYMLLEYLIEKDGNSINKTAYLNDAEQCKKLLFSNYGDSEAAKILQEMMFLEQPMSNNIPSEYYMGYPYPNPFNPVVNIYYELPEPTQVNINIYNIAGQKVKTLIDNNQSPGRYNLSFNASQFASGIYIVRVLTPSYSETKKILLLK